MRKNLRLRRILATGAALAVLGGGAVAGAGSASAAEKDGGIEWGEFGLYFNAGSGYPVFDLYNGDTDFRDDLFAGYDYSPNNNTRSYANLDTYSWRVFKNTQYTGDSRTYASGAVGDLPSTFWDTVSSATWV